MAYTGLYGALSKAIGESLGGVSEGALAGEEVRHKRSSEALQRDYLQHALQQAAQQQQYQQGILGIRTHQGLLEQLRAVEQAAHNRAMEQHAGEQSALGWTRESREDVAGRERRAETARTHQATETDRANRTKILEGQLKVNQDRAATMARRIDQLARGGTSYTPAQRAALEALKTKLHIASRNMGIASNFQTLGTPPPGIPTVADAKAEMDRIAEQIDQFAQGVAGGGTGAPTPKADPMAELRAKYPKLKF